MTLARQHAQGAIYRNLAEMFFARASTLADRPRYRVKRDGAWCEVGWRDVATAVREVAAGLIDDGLSPGDKVAILSGTRPEWVEADLAIYSCGGITVPIYQSNLPHECGYILTNSESRVCFVENAKQLAKIRAVQRAGFEIDGQRSNVEVSRLVLMEGEPDGGDVIRLLWREVCGAPEHRESPKNAAAYQSGGSDRRQSQILRSARHARLR